MPRNPFIAVLTALAFPALAAPVPITCGGVGSDERHALESRAAESNLAIEMFVAPGGEYVADVDVTLRTGSDSLQVHADGPLCYLTVPAGKYQVEATYRGITRSASASVAASPGRPAHVSLAFPKSVGDRENDRATPEEKAQAAARP